MDKTYWVAFSGGLDSTVLLHLFSDLRELHEIRFKAIYVNHGSHNALAWAKHCKETCQTLQIEFVDEAIPLQKTLGQSPENRLRQERYAIFTEEVLDHDYLLTAHQQDVQAETVLLPLLRGAGPQGLAAMPHIKPFAKGFHARPLLNFSRAELKDYAEEKQLQWIEDESNTDLKLTRNFLRHDVMPVLTKRWPNVGKTLCRVASHSAKAEELMASVAKNDLATVTDEGSDSRSITLSIKKLLQFSPCDRCKFCALSIA